MVVSTLHLAPASFITTAHEIWKALHLSVCRLPLLTHSVTTSGSSIFSRPSEPLIATFFMRLRVSLMTNVQCTMNYINLLAYLLSHCRDVSLQILGLLITYFLLVVQFSNPTTGSTYITIVTTNSSIMDLKSTSGL